MRSATRSKRWALVVLAVLPFQLPLWQHLSVGPFATGFLQYDAPYYAANGREVFERGNGLFHPNPYDPDPAAPVIYFQWLTWLLGFGVKILRTDPGMLWAAIGVIASVAGSALTLRLVETVLPRARGRALLFLLTMWGGGCLCLAAIASNFTADRAAWDNVMAFDRADGWWFPNWGRNFVMPTEAVYHLLVAAAWLGVLQRRWRLAIGAVGLLATTHPFSGVQHLLILGAWLGWLAWRERTPAAWARAGFVLTMLAAFFAYYLWFLNLFPTHRALVQKWSYGWDMPLAEILLASGPVALVAAWRLRRMDSRPTEGDRFLLVAFTVTLLLLKHDWFIAPRQPAHFSRGYNWLPLWLIALPLLQTWGEKLFGLRRRWLAGLALLFAAGLICFDNAVFVGHELKRGEVDRVHLSPAQREMLAWIDRQELDGVLLTSDPRLSYLSATYSSARPYYGHLANTPDVHDRWRQVAAWHSGGEQGDWLRSVDYVLVDRTNPPANFDWPRWRELHRNRDYILLGHAP